MEKSNNSSGDGEDYSCELPNFELKFFAWPPPEKYANLSEQELNRLVEQIKALGTRRRTKKQPTGLYQLFEVSNA